MAMGSQRLRDRKRGADLRNEIRNYIRNERTNISTQWLAFKENVKAEEKRRENFLRTNIQQSNHIVPESIEKFIGSLKRAVRKTMIAKGGTCSSIIRDMFLYWDSDRSGTISMSEMKTILRSLAIMTTPEEDSEIMQYYCNNINNKQEVNYNTLLKDIERGEPSIIAFVDEQVEQQRVEEKYFEEIGAASGKNVPPVVKQFIEIIQEFIATKMRNEGGTPFSVCHDLMQKYDYDYSTGLNASELQTACVRGMKMSITLDQAAEIIKYYDKKRNGELVLESFFPHISHGTQPLLHFVVKTPRTLSSIRDSLSKNPLLPKPFRSAPNKTLEKFKIDVKNSLRERIKANGGSVKSWVTEAFSSWDPKGLKTLSRLDHIIGAVNRLGVEANEELAKVLMKSYDRDGDGRMHYTILLDELSSDDAHFMEDAMMTSRRRAEEASINNSSSATARIPPAASATILKVRTAVAAYVRKAKGNLMPKDLLHGLCLRHDPKSTGRLSIDQLSKVCHDLRIPVERDELLSLMTWFDTDGSRMMDYDAFSRELFGEDITTAKLVLPKLSSGEQSLLASSALYQSLPGSFILKKTSDEKIDMTRERNMQPIESQAVVLARSANIRKKILSERAKVERKLQSVEEQRKKIVDEFKERQKSKNEAQASQKIASLSAANLAKLNN